MGVVITFGIQKGGAAKTTTSGIIAHLLSLEYNVLCVDMDSQGNLTELLTQRDIYDFSGRTVLEALKEQDPTKYIYKINDKLSILPAEDFLATFPRWLYSDYRGNKSLVLRETLHKIKDQYDFIIIDTPPALGDQTINALAASDCVVAMFETSKFCYSALSRFIETVEQAQKKINPDLQFTGILRAMIDVRRSDNKAFLEVVEEEYGDLCFNTVIVRQAATGRISTNGFMSNPELNTAVTQFKNVLKELLERVNQRSVQRSH